jgi:aspartate kinase
LIELARRGDRRFIDGGVTPLQERHLEAARALAPGNDAVIERLDVRLRELRVLLRGVCLTARATPQAIDAVLGFGELLAQELVVAALRSLGSDAAAIDSRELVVTDDRFGAAVPDLPELARRCRALASRLAGGSTIAVLGGYVGATTEGIPTTLGRGGSDLSASLVGLGLGARVIEIWTDVDGLMTADPRWVPDARLIPRASFSEASELAGLGAKVLHPASIDPAVQAGIPVVIRNSLAPERAGTWIDAQASIGDGIRAIAARSGLVLFSLTAPGATRDPAFLPQVLSDDLGPELPPTMVHPGPLGVELLIADGAGVDDAAVRLARRGRLEVRRTLATIAVVGEAAGSAVWGAVIARLADWPVLRVATGPRNASLQMVIEESHAPSVVRALHEAFITRELPVQTPRGSSR